MFIVAGLPPVRPDFQTGYAATYATVNIKSLLDVLDVETSASVISSVIFDNALELPDFLKTIIVLLTPVKAPFGEVVQPFVKPIDAA
mgnify:CR=1 FL=1